MTETTILLAGADPRATPQYQDFIWSVDGEERRFDLPGEIDFLKPNGLGGYKISVSALSSWSRCPLAKFYDDRARYVQDAPQPKRLSATQFGSVMHVVLMQMDRAIHEGEENALEQAIRTFEHYWDPNNITAICERVDTWIGKQTYGGLRDKGRTALRNLYEVLSREDVWRLAHEYHFAVPIIVNGRTHTLNGFVDRLSIKKHSNRRPYLCTDDWKSGKQHKNLRQHLQGTAYSYASTLPEFWLGWPDSGLGELEPFSSEAIGAIEEGFNAWGFKLHRGSDSELPLASRRFRWGNVMDARFADGGWRSERDYARLALVVDGYVRAREVRAYSANTEGEVCGHCSHQTYCGGIGLAQAAEGAPL